MAKITRLNLDEVKKKKIDELNNQCEATILSGFVSTTTTHKYGFSTYDQMNLTQQMILMLKDTTITSVYWKTEDAGILSHTRDEFFSITSEAEQHKRNNIQKYWDLKAKVQAALSENEVSMITW
jgi:hypothetical protein